MKQMFSLRFDKSLLERMRLFIKKDGCGSLTEIIEVFVREFLDREEHKRKSEADKLQNAAGYQ